MKTREQRKADAISRTYETVIAKPNPSAPFPHSTFSADSQEDFIKRVNEFCGLDGTVRPEPGEIAVDFLNRCYKLKKMERTP